MKRSRSTGLSVVVGCAMSTACLVLGAVPSASGESRPGPAEERRDLPISSGGSQTRQYQPDHTCFSVDCTADLIWSCLKAGAVDVWASPGDFPGETVVICLYEPPPKLP